MLQTWIELCVPTADYVWMFQCQQGRQVVKIHVHLSTWDRHKSQSPTMSSCPSPCSWHTWVFFLFLFSFQVDAMLFKSAEAHGQFPTQVELELEEPQLSGGLILLFSLDKRPLIPNDCMLNIYYCLSTVSWEGHQGFYKGVVKPTFTFSVYQQPCNLGGLKYGQSACYSTSPGCSCSFTLHANSAPTPPASQTL